MLPVNVITGFLGSGKTTLLRRVLASDGSGDTAVLINEFGEIGIDHLLVGEIAPNAVLLKSGCVCCSIRGELKDALAGLFSQRQRGQVPAFRRVLVETTGLADPAPIVATLLGDPVLRHHYRLGLIITTVDCVNAELHRSTQPEWWAQVTAADRIVLTKSDLVSQQACGLLTGELRDLNPAATLALAQEVTEADLFLLGHGLHDEEPSAEVKRWFERSPRHRTGVLIERLPGVQPSALPHQDLASFCVEFANEINWTAFGLWLSLLLHRHGKDILRVKGILNLAGLPFPVAIHGVQHLVHPPVHLPAWGDADRRSRIVFIVRGIDQQWVERSFHAFAHR